MLIAENLTLLLRKIILEYLHQHKAYFATTFTTFHDLLLPYIALTPRQPNCELKIVNCELQLLFPDKHIDGTSMHGPMLTNLIFQETTVVLLDILWQVGIKYK